MPIAVRNCVRTSASVRTQGHSRATSTLHKTETHKKKMDISATAHAFSHAFFTRRTGAAAAWRGVVARCAQGVAGQHRRSIPFLPAFALVLGLAACGGGGGGGGGGGVFIPSYNSGTAPAQFIRSDGPPPPPGPNDVFVASTPTLPQDIDSGSTAASYVAPNQITPTAVTGGASDIRMANVSGGTMNGSRLFAISRDIVTGLSTGTDSGGGTAPRLGGTGSGSGTPRIGFQGAVTTTAFNTMINDVFKFSRDAMLTTSIGTEVETRVAKVEYAEGSSFRVLQHNYVGRRSSMYLLFPESGSQAVIVAGMPTAMTTIAALSGKYTYTGVVRAGDVAGEGANSASSVNKHRHGFRVAGELQIQPARTIHSPLQAPVSRARACLPQAAPSPWRPARSPHPRPRNSGPAAQRTAR